MTVSPVHIEMSAAGRANRGQVTVVNNSDAPLPIEAVLRAVTFDENGKAETSKAGDDFLIMPPQALVPPGATQIFRVHWLGNPTIETSRSYLLYLSQVPTRSAKGRLAVQVVMSIGVLINVAPAQGNPSLEVVSSAFETGATGKRRPRITIANKSNVHAQLRQSTIRLTDGKWSASVPPGTIEQTIGIGLVQPGRRRHFTLPIEVPPGVGRLRVDVEPTAPRR